MKLDLSLTLHSMHSKISVSLLHLLCAFQFFAEGNIRLQAEHLIDFILSIDIIDGIISDFLDI